MDLLQEYIDELKAVRAAISKLTADPTISQTVSTTNGGSFSASYADVGKLYARERELVTRIADLHRAREGVGTMTLSYPIYCGG